MGEKVEAVGQYNSMIYKVEKFKIQKIGAVFCFTVLK